MKRTILLFSLLLFSLNGFAQAQILVGDILLLPLDCLACSLIEAEEETIYSHMGIVIATNPEVLIAEAWGKVRLSALSDFTSRTEKGQKIAVLRYRNERIQKDLIKNANKNLAMFTSRFENKKYDHDFLWNNFDENGEEKFYCSELVSKMLQSFISLETPVKRMHFNQNRDKWSQYFKGNIPDGKWGNSPGDFERSELFFKAGEL